jgi:hypothetical protein
MCSVLEPGRTEWNGSIPRAWNRSDPVFGLEKFEERRHAASPVAGTRARQDMPPPGHATNGIGGRPLLNLD